ncbi:MAG: DUF4349 domain-containing protein [Firmicutes bacterium]|nr:DUF4349 domain-containing protein [Bacillota bacterium]
MAPRAGRCALNVDDQPGADRRSRAETLGLDSSRPHHAGKRSGPRQAGAVRGGRDGNTAGARDDRAFRLPGRHGRKRWAEGRSRGGRTHPPGPGESNRRPSEWNGRPRAEGHFHRRDGDKGRVGRRGRGRPGAAGGIHGRFRPIQLLRGRFREKDGGNGPAHPGGAVPGIPGCGRPPRHGDEETPQRPGCNRRVRGSGGAPTQLEESGASIEPDHVPRQDRGEVLAVQDKLGQVREEIERLEGRIKYIDYNAALATVNVDLYEGTKPAGPPWLRRELSALGRVLYGSCRGLLTALLVLAPWALAGWIVYRLGRRFIGKARKGEHN